MQPPDVELEDPGQFPQDPVTLQVVGYDRRLEQLADASLDAINPSERRRLPVCVKTSCDPSSGRSRAAT
jgi:hypothetical protein